MRKVAHAKQLAACVGCLALGMVWGSTGFQGASAQPGAAALVRADTAALNNETKLASNLWVQTSGEYRACCLQIFKCGEMRLESLLKSADPKPARPAVIMDLDETVLDNSAFQTFLYKNNLQFSNSLWAEYEASYTQDATLVPGAKQFIAKAESLGVTVIYISNRQETFSKPTIAALQRLGISTKSIDSRLLMRAQDGTIDKASRRESASTRFNVLLNFGDNLRDFSESFLAPKLGKETSAEDYLKAIQARLALTDETAGHWGTDWFVIPNPVYGEWERLVWQDPTVIMHPTTMIPPRQDNTATEYFMRQPKWTDAQQFRRGEPAVHRPPGLSAEGLAADSEHVQAEQFLDCFVGIATLHEADGYQGPVRPGETVGAWIVAAEGTRRPEGCEPGSAAATVGQWCLGLGDVLRRVGDIGAEADVIDADQLHRIIDVVEQFGDSSLASQER